MSDSNLLTIPRPYSPVAIFIALALILGGLVSLPSQSQAVETEPTWANSADMANSTFGGIFNTYQEKNIAFTATTFRANGGNVTYAVTAGELPTGVSLDSLTGDIFGTATVPGYVSFTITASNSAGSISLQTSMLIGRYLGLRQNPVSGVQGQEFASTPIQTRGGSFSISTTGATLRIDGTLPAGVSYTVSDASTPGVIPRAFLTGTPTETGTFPLTIVIEDQQPDPLSATFDLVITAPVSGGGGGGGGGGSSSGSDSSNALLEIPTEEEALEEARTEAELLAKEQARERRKERAAERERIAEEQAVIALRQAREARKNRTLEIAEAPVFVIRQRGARPGSSFSESNPMSKRLQAILSKPLAYPGRDSSSDGSKDSGSLPQLNPQQALLVENSVATEFSIETSASNTGYLVSGDDWQVALEAADENGTPLNLDDSGNIILNSDRNVSFSGTGYAPGSTVKVWMFSDPTSVTQVTADESGEFKGLAQIPAGLPDGEHTLQLNGVNKNGQIRSVAMGVLIAPGATPAVPAVPATPSAVASIDPLWLAPFALMLIALGAVLWFRRRKALKTRSRDLPGDDVVIELYPKAS
jgi:hypothetical protein